MITWYAATFTIRKCGNEGKWTLYKYSEADITEVIDEDDDEPGNKELFNSMLQEFNMMNQQ
jgi:hypothetical protein